MFAAALQLAPLFPGGSKIIETRFVRSDRVIVLWMEKPVEKPRPCPSLDDWAESCPDKTRGCYFRGPTRVSLVDAASGRVINTIKIENPYDGEDVFDIPFKVMTPGPYRFDAKTRRPEILWLRDYNGDGKALEFALFDAADCSDLFTSLLGYSEKQDALLQYKVHVHYDKDNFVTVWPEHLFNIKPKRMRFWRYRLGYPPGPPDAPYEYWTVRYIPDREEFEARCVTAMH
jgi:hypothetical protein